MAETDAASDENTWIPKEDEVGIRVRMYRVGFGDFFLVTLLDEQKNPAHIIIDCGVFKGTSQKGDIGSLEDAVKNMVETTQGDVSLIIMTHRHADHIAGFARFSEQFRSLRVGAVWMPIWESQYEPAAVKFQLELARTARGLQRHFMSLGARLPEAARTAQSFMENATGELGPTDPQAANAAVDAADAANAAATEAAAGAASNDIALEVLKGFASAPPQYYKAGDTPILTKALSDLGLTCQVLGPPPVDDLALMKLMDLQKGVGQYLTSDDEGEPDEAFAPFGREWEVAPDDVLASGDGRAYPIEAFREWAPRPAPVGEPSADEQASCHAMERVLRRAQPIAALTAAKQLNAFLNNQSLVTLFTFKGKKLLFVGDAQGGNWEHWLFATDTPDKAGTGTPAKDAQQILTSLDFYKVGHHGSGNATPKAALGLMKVGHRFACMCSTEKDVYGTENPDDESKGTEVPRLPLLADLAADGAIVRSDQIEIDLNGRRVPAAAPADLPGDALKGCRFDKGSVWIDCFL